MVTLNKCACVGIQTNIRDFSCLIIILQILTLTKNNTSLNTVITLQYSMYMVEQMLNQGWLDT